MRAFLCAIALGLCMISLQAQLPPGAGGLPELSMDETAEGRNALDGFAND